MKIKVMLAIFLLLNIFVMAEVNESAMIGFAELDGEVVMIFKDAVTNEPLSDLSVSLLKKDDFGEKEIKVLKTDFQGVLSFEISWIDDVMDGKIYVMAEREGYIKFMEVVDIMVGSIFKNTFVMSKFIPLEKVRFVLTWDDAPTDLDLHLEGKSDSGESFHISYRDKTSVNDMAVLDRDDRDGYGPETITLDKIKEGWEYSLFIKNFSNDRPFDSNIAIHVYKNNKLDKIVRIKKTNKRNVQILKIKNKEIDYINMPY